MVRRFALIVFLLTTLTGATALTDEQKPIDTIKPGELLIETTPTGVAVSAGKIELGASPIRWKIGPGEYELVFRLDRHRIEKRTVQVQSGISTKVHVQMVGFMAKLFVKVTPSSARVSLNLAQSLSAPAEFEVPAGKHRLSAACEGYDLLVKMVTLNAGQSSTVVLDLQKKVMSKLLVNTMPRGANVAVDHKHAGVSPIEVAVEHGKHTVEVSADSFEPTSTSIDIGRGASHSVELKLTPIYPMALHKKWGHAAFWTGLGLTVVGGTAAAMADSWADKHSTGNYPQAADNSRAWAGFMWTSFGISAALMVTGSVLWAISPTDKGWYDANHPRFTASPTPKGVVLGFSSEF